jgi:hypothetical protein
MELALIQNQCICPQCGSLLMTPHDAWRHPNEPQPAKCVGSGFDCKWTGEALFYMTGERVLRGPLGSTYAA